MKYTASVFLVSAGWATALTQQCSGTATNEGGNWFCGAVNQILYQGIKGSGTFKAVTNMGASGACQTEDKAYSGPLAPLDEGLSLQFRGPLWLKEFAVLNPATKSKRTAGENVEAPRQSDVRGRSHSHNHKRLHRSHRNKKREDIVHATIDGKLVSWVNDYHPDAAPAAPAAANSVPIVQVGVGSGAASAPASSSSTSSDSPKPDGKPAPSGSDWDRVAYYNAEEKIAENMVFMGNYGGQGSGEFNTVWGSSLAYLNAQGDGGSSSPQILKDGLIPSNKEFAIFSAEKCDETCGYSRVSDIAYKGFSGANKVFLFRFKMPMDGNRGFNGDMPALWALNSRIPRTAQYNACSCWPACGEADFFEVLASGDTKCKSTFHLANGGGSSDYFDRPVDKFIKAAVVFHEATASVSIKILPDDTDLSAKGFDDATVMKWVSQPTDASGLKLSSLFQILS
ncbi:uncharacterized protein UV8b_02191 [Ustilaginoidea virens]|uniref:glucan endo-1,3-beta-D-glucosidase n=1 Tax=Ustilaginoidea virens TaxID=1159556 RepID=A0A8E5HM08_USTVR|nr:uncharacterized protein UV8b_02191 [Ustilaginoidea virens]QUC17950.1 hypothetical protein UV8b_02191 [Ustilaginoidea virens]